MSSRSVYGVVLLPGERAQLLHLIDQHGTPGLQERIRPLVANACDLGSLRELAASVEPPGRQAGSRSTPTTTNGDHHA